MNNTNTNDTANTNNANTNNMNNTSNAGLRPMRHYPQLGEGFGAATPEELGQLLGLAREPVEFPLTVEVSGPRDEDSARATVSSVEELFDLVGELSDEGLQVGCDLPGGGYFTSYSGLLDRVACAVKGVPLR
jgi:hypothetical protein